MVRPANAARQTIKMVELRGVEPEFPLYGTMTLADGQAYSHRLVEGHGALVRPELLSLLDLQRR